MQQNEHIRVELNHLLLVLRRKEGKESVRVEALRYRSTGCLVRLDFATQRSLVFAVQTVAKDE